VTLALALSQRSSAHHPEKLAELADKDGKRAEESRRHQRQHTKTLLKDTSWDVFKISTQSWGFCERLAALKPFQIYLA
jgi:hypothetical protein